MNTLWCFFITIQIQLDKDWISIFFTPNMKILSNIYKKIVINNVHHSNVIIAGD